MPEVEEAAGYVSSRRQLKVTSGDVSDRINLFLRGHDISWLKESCHIECNMSDKLTHSDVRLLRM